ncbi:MAG TPA: hypothetical protein VFD55_01465 [Candidatus Angelobacter sp.]|nr:hypothetical protein [Candidatus Angelobacter sp.]
MENETEMGIVERVNVSDLLELHSWDKPRTTEQLLGFIARRESEIFANDDE